MLSIRPATMNPIVQEDSPAKYDKSVVRRERIEDENFASLTATGTTSRLLVINRGTLVPGNIYIVQLTVAKKGQSELVEL